MDKEKLMTEEEWLAKYNAGQKKAKRKNVRKWVRNGVALGLVAVLSIAGTLAYLQKKTDDKVNTFTGSTGLKLMLTENQWDPDNDKDEDDDDPYANARKYIPGNTYAKNPQLINQETATWSDVQTDAGTNNVKLTDSISNLSGTYDYSEYVAFEVDLLDQNTSSNTPLTYEKLTHVIEDIVFDSDNWVLIAYYDSSWTSLVSNAKNYFKTSSEKGNLDTANTGDLSNATKFVFAYATVVSDGGSGYFYQYTPLAANNATKPLFSGIKIKQDVYDFGSGDGTKVTDPTSYPKFDIKLIGGAVDTKTYGSATGDNQKTQIGSDLLEVLGAVNPNP